MNTPDNSPAFPSHELNDDGTYYRTHPGMTLRDWFAGQVLPTVSVAHPEWKLKAWFGDRTGIKNEEIAARAAYELADAMLVERLRKWRQS